MDKFVVHELSMTPTLMPGDRILAASRPPEVGRIAVIPSPLDPSMMLVKRVVAGPGWDVRIIDTRLELTAPGGVAAVTAIPAEHRPRAWSLEDDEMFVLSDSPASTRADSRVFGPVPCSTALTVVLRYRPLRRIRRL